MCRDIIGKLKINFQFNLYVQAKVFTFACAYRDIRLYLLKKTDGSARNTISANKKRHYHGCI